ncbi:Gfo/Idh/MocA family oxidoreductase [Psychrosphaera ytuae]|uniref:Gfo/Idh/MocA family oxidoreductase n=1 Tax=Psychrosphaera ytuae TaxID=2820710 RepID=A0A975HI45_9GAMM|nr:Gfo/Idh/MocA family oxidoreductase [Psychrosphaera ytuae]QTH63807.1 Gfo/Idh/MocA family oxidoreductase [Psychrosphaera ytuae]
MSASTKSFLIIGSGNIAKRHVKTIRTEVDDAFILLLPSRGVSSTEQEAELTNQFRDVDAVIASSLDIPRHLFMTIIASPAPLHHLHVEQIINKSERILIEKPIAENTSTARRIVDLCQLHQTPAMVGYCLRYLGSADIVRSKLKQGVLGKVLLVKSNVGQYLPSWRPGDYRHSVSANKSLGGGALLELSHELDLVCHLFDVDKVINATVCQSESLDIDVEDMVQINLSNNDGALISVGLDFLQHKASRTMTIIGTEATIQWDLIKNSITLTDKQGDSQSYSGANEWQGNDMYIAQLRDFMTSKSTFRGSKPDEALRVVQLIDDIRHLAQGV